MHTRDEALVYLRTMTQNPHAEFREDQWEAIDAVVNRNKKLLLVEKTGWGKSAVYFIATKLKRLDGFGLTVIISPLLALMRNQIAAAKRCGLRAASINSENEKEWKEIQTLVINNQIDILLICPERLANEDFIQNTFYPIASTIGLFVVDEVHCISDWGHDFRPDYRRIKNILKSLPDNTPLIGTTATANNRVVKDVKDQFSNSLEVLRGSLLRETLSLDCIRLADKAERLAWLAEVIPQIEGSGIVYVQTVRDTELLSEWLCKNGIKAYPHSGENNKAEGEKTNAEIEELLINNKVKVVVATSALGMGFDKPDLNFVFHFQAPGSIVAYYQQVGRAGRAQQHSYGVLLSGKEDSAIQEYFRDQAFPTEELINQILSALDKSDDGLTLNELLTLINARKKKFEQALKYLATENPAPVYKEGNRWKRLPYDFHMDREKVEFLTHQKEMEWHEIERYIDCESCKMQFLARALNDESGTCNKCSSCTGTHFFGKDLDVQLVSQAKAYLRSRYISFEPRKQFNSNLLSEYGFRTGSRNNFFSNELLHETGWILCTWGEGTLGEAVAKQKHAGYFDDSLLTAFIEMLRAKSVDSSVKWVTALPSGRHPGLVSDFAERVAQKLEIPYIDIILKKKENLQQKGQNNSAQQQKNLNGVFSLKELPPSAPVLLIDDAYDSGWTMAVVSAVLRQNGSGRVYPVCLAKTSTNN